MIKNTLIPNTHGKYIINGTEYLPPDGFKQVVVICHGFASNQHRPSVEIVAKNLLVNNIAAITFDFPNHGVSSADSALLTVENCIRDVLCIQNFVQQTYQIPKVSLFGISFGGYIILNTLLRDEDKFDKIILRSPAVNMKDILIRKLTHITPEMYQKEGVIHIGYMNKLSVPYPFYIDLCQNDLLSQQQTIQKEILIIHGKMDDTADINDTYSLIKQTAINSRLIEMPDTNHIMSVDEINTVTDYLIKYITGN